MTGEEHKVLIQLIRKRSARAALLNPYVTLSEGQVAAIREVLGEEGFAEAMKEVEAAAARWETWFRGPPSTIYGIPYWCVMEPLPEPDVVASDAASETDAGGDP